MTPTEQPEKQWIAAYRKGDIDALGKLVEHFRRPLYAFILNMLQGRGDPEDVFQEVWLKAIQHFDRYRDHQFLSWLFRIAHNLIIDRFRREKKENRAEERDPDPAGEGLIASLPARGPTPDRQSAHADLGHRINAALAALPDDQREVFLMRTEGDVPFKEIAAIQGATLNTVLSRMHYALQKLRPLLQEEYANWSGEHRHET